MLEQEIVRRPKSGKTARSPFREWLGSVLFAVVVATIIRWLFFSAFVIPTPSMENTLLVGDYLFVSKLHYGATTPATPLQIPLTHQTIWGTSLPSYLDWIKLPQMRLPGFSEVKRGDVVVFNLPVEHPDLYQKYGNVLPDLKPHPVDLRTNYIKRCVAQAGDTLQVIDGQVVVNGSRVVNPVRMQNEYFVSTTGPVNEVNIFKKNGVTAFSSYTETFGDTISANDEFCYILHTTETIAEKLRTYAFVRGISRIHSAKGQAEPFLFPATSGWNKDQYGPFIIPRKGLEINLSPGNVSLYGEVIKFYEGNDDITVSDSEIKSGGVILKSYTFKQDYFFMMGDNRHQSADSRYWGLVPKDHVVGKAVFVWMSIDPDPTRFFHKIRWDRLFRVIE
ncbi:signal peptidase I [Dyadobacter sp. 32]|uniref:signal peptidase I n=1 Tax=Dyadobacter sp. 32 TaxID=538966 RepID=UPI0011F0890B